MELQLILSNLSIKTSRFGKIVTYVQGLVSLANRKTCIQMASMLDITHDTLQRILDKYKNESDSILKALKDLISQFKTPENPGYWVLDDTCLAKPYGDKMHGSEYVFSSLLGAPVKGYSYLFLVWTNGKITIPVKFVQWIPEELCEKGDYRKKSEIAEEMISQIIDNTFCMNFLLDGLFQSVRLMEYLDSNGCSFYMRLSRSRTISSSCDEKPVKLSKNKSFYLRGNQRSKTWDAVVSGEHYFVTGNKLKKRNGDYHVVFIISNRKHDSPKTIIAIYEMRWYIEKFFRTAKQSLGLQHCQTRSIRKHEVHIAAVCIAYVHLEEIKIRENLDSPEEAQRWLQELKTLGLRKRETCAGECFHAVA